MLRRRWLRARAASDEELLGPPREALFPGGGLPTPETLVRRGSIQFVAIVALIASAVYLTWRVGSTLGSLWISIPLWILELHAAVGLGLFAFSLWNLDRQVIPELVQRTGLRVGVLIPTYNEPLEVLFPTVAAAVALEPQHEIYVLDDGRRLWVRAMAASLGARYIAREERTHAKAGNINHALAQLDLDVIGVLDADHIADAGFLTHTLGYFEDPQVAVVQTPQDFYNLDSFEHGKNRSWFWRGRRSISFNEQRLFYRAIQPGKNRWKAVFWCGTNAVVRVSAIREIGGIACETVTEDMHTTIRLHRQGWRSVYHTFALQRLAMALLSRGYAPQGMAALFEFVRLQSNIKATLTYVHRGERPFRVTAKHGTDERRRIQAPWSLWLLLGLTGVALIWFACTVAGLTPITYHVQWTAYGAVFFGLVNLGFLVAALSRIRSDRFASERRTAVRLQTGGPASIEGRPGHLLDLSMSGAMVRCDRPLEHREEPLKIEFDCAGNEIALLGEERGRQDLADGSAIIRLRFVEQQAPELARMARALFGSTHPSPSEEAGIEESAA